MRYTWNINDIDKCINNILVNIRDNPRVYRPDSFGMELYNNLVKKFGQNEINKLRRKY